MLESRPAVKGVSPELSMTLSETVLLLTPASLSESSSSESDSEPEILDKSPVK